MRDVPLTEGLAATAREPKMHARCVLPRGPEPEPGIEPFETRQGKCFNQGVCIGNLFDLDEQGFNNCTANAATLMRRRHHDASDIEMERAIADDASDTSDLATGDGAHCTPRVC